MSDRVRYDRQSTLLEMTETRVGRLLMRGIARQVRSVATTKDEERVYAGAAGYMTVEKLVRMSDGKLPWGVADSLLDIANGQPSRVVGRVVGTARARLRGRRAAEQDR